MGRRFVSTAFVVPLLLVILVGILATLQYRWLGKVSDAERDQMARSVSQRAHEFADDFDRDLTRLYLGLQAAHTSALSGPVSPALMTAIERWRPTARYPQIIKRVALVSGTGIELSWCAIDLTTGVIGDPQPWPERLSGIRSYVATAQITAAAMPPMPSMVTIGRANRATRVPGMAPEPSTVLQVIAVSGAGTFPDVPAVVVPLPRPIAGEVTITTTERPGSGAALQRLFASLKDRPAALVVEFDDRVLNSTVLPDLVQRYFPGDAADVYHVAVLASDAQVRYTRGFDATQPVKPGAGDTVVPLFVIRPELTTAGEMTGSTAAARSANTVISRTVGTEAPAVTPGAAGGDGPTRQVTWFEGRSLGVRVRTGAPQPAAWQLVVRHRSGSLDAAVGAARARNLWLSFGILGVLLAGLLLVVRNARRAESLAARQIDFVATVSHELRTPLTVIRSAAQNLSAGVINDPAQARQYGELIDNEGRRLTDMVEQVMDYAGLEGHRRVRSPRPVDLVAVVEKAAASCRAVCAAAGCVLDVTLPDAEATAVVMGDDGALGRVVTNLIANAAKHGADGRWIGVTLGVYPRHGVSEVQLSVTDRGRGIDDGELPHVFDAFWRGRHATSQQVQGSGLGLSLVRRIVEAHGGRVTVTSTPGLGASFVVYLPALAGEGGAP